MSHKVDHFNYGTACLVALQRIDRVWYVEWMLRSELMETKELRID